jgi:hypothetical protein
VLSAEVETIYRAEVEDRVTAAVRRLLDVPALSQRIATTVRPQVPLGDALQWIESRLQADRTLRWSGAVTAAVRGHLHSAAIRATIDDAIRAAAQALTAAQDTEGDQ